MQWGGLVGNFHAPRYQLFVTQALAALERHSKRSGASGAGEAADWAGALAGGAFDQALYDQLSLNMTIDWTNQPWDQSVFPAMPVSDPVTVSARLLKKYPLDLGGFKCPPARAD
jgi:hypothetical protein